MKYQIVVARYNENIHYLEKYKDIIIVYNKGELNISSLYETITLPNIGRESHTYLYHIINNYDTLADYTFFRQGYMEDHNTFSIDEYLQEKKFIGNLSTLPVRTLNENIKHYGKFLQDLKSGNLKKSPMNPYQWFLMIGLKLSMNSNFNMVWGANFSVSKELILKKPKSFYEYLIQFVEYSSNPEEGHYFERGWHIIFEHPTFIKRKKVKIINSLQSKDAQLREQYLNIKTNDEIGDVHIWTDDIHHDDFNNSIIYRTVKMNVYYKLHKDMFLNGNKFKVNTNQPLEMKIEFDTYFFTFLINHDRKCSILFNGNIHVGTIQKQLDMDKTGISIRVQNLHMSIYYVNRVIFNIVLPDDCDIKEFYILSKNKPILYLDYKINQFHTKLFETLKDEIIDKDIYRLRFCDNYPEFIKT